MRILGLMSGTSLDGLDIAYCEFSSPDSFKLLAAETVPYPTEWRQRLASLYKASAMEYAMADVELGRFFGEKVLQFRNAHPGEVDCIASHGHTVFHQPERRMTAQIGDGNAIHAVTGLPVVHDFRRLDVALGGQGAPLVPIGDRLLFGQYDSCINLGGIANISYEADGQRIAYDICPCNMALNWLAAKAGASYDHDGQTAASGHIIDRLLSELNSIGYYSQQAPKTLGKEWFESSFLPLLEQNITTPIPDLLRTTTEHIACQLCQALTESGSHVIIVTGGGAKNKFLMQRVTDIAPNVTIHECDPLIVDYKEAIIFALLAYLRLSGQNNTLASVTGACRDSSGGVICGPIK